MCFVPKMAVINYPKSGLKQMKISFKSDYYDRNNNNNNNYYYFYFYYSRIFVECKRNCLTGLDSRATLQKYMHSENIICALKNKTIIFNLTVGDGSDLSTSRRREEVCMSIDKERERERESVWWSTAMWSNKLY